MTAAAKEVRSRINDRSLSMLTWKLRTHRSRYETVDTTSLDCALLSNRFPVSGYWPIFSAMQISTASKSATLCLPEIRLVLI